MRVRGVGRFLWGLLLAIGMVVGGVAVTASAYDEGTIVALANDARAANGLGGLVRNGALDAVAANWVSQMAASETLSHNPSVGSEIPGGWTSWGENVAQGYASGAAVHDGWMNSSGHRANILGAFTDIGVALISAGGTTWAVQVFASYPGSGLPAPAPPPPAPAPEPAPAPAEPEAAAPAEPAVAETPPPTETSTPTPTPSRTSSPTIAPTSTTPTPVPLAADAVASSVSSASTWWPWSVMLAIAAIFAIAMLPPVQRMLHKRSH